MPPTEPSRTPLGSSGPNVLLRLTIGFLWFKPLLSWAVYATPLAMHMAVQLCLS
ncbi:uncharacterized protein M421DRAFT_285800 [Didymella exigua CBS 183.55]|uniref:Uncharacterized protein n=1 Tax=Didymella exigua CBS 183.55 TaxID=1150837 RepID=A0A6A5RWB0_9PLEO|nr:uncharacterized protein M421DRAFT_285800 [Didymella exigua CBS 183.55]KAF1932172.1 hypothetical protein M421DRAFT_285800 [Didymella exigua CBS 183.55]